MLLDSHDLQEAVFEAEIPAEMLASVEELDVIGIAILPGPMRKMLGIDHPFISPPDFEDQVVGVTQSDVADQTMAALGATALDMGGGMPLDGIDALEQQFDSIVANSYTEVGSFVTANINLWPRPQVIVMNAERFGSLSAEQQTALRNAGEALIPGELDAARREDVHGATIICRTDTAVAVATEDDLAAMHAALEPVYANLASDPVTAQHIETITALKEQVAAPPDSAECEPAVADRSGFPQGTFEKMQYPSDARPGCGWQGNEATSRLELADGVYAFTQDGVLQSPRARYEVFEDHVTFEGEFSGRWTFDGTTLTFSQMTAPDGKPIACDAAIVWGIRPWVFVTEDEAADTTAP
jgi:hypothetical protein